MSECDELADRPGDLTGDDYDRLFSPPEPEELLPPIPPCGWDELA